MPGACPGRSPDPIVSFDLGFAQPGEDQKNKKAAKVKAKGNKKGDLKSDAPEDDICDVQVEDESEIRNMIQHDALLKQITKLSQQVPPCVGFVARKVLCPEDGQAVERSNRAFRWHWLNSGVGKGRQSMSSFRVASLRDIDSS